MSKQTMALMEQCAPIFSMLQDDRRREIMQVLFDRGELSVSELTDQMSLSRPAVSHHLKLLLDAHLLYVRKEGKERFYKINLLPSLTLLKQLTQSLDDDFAQLNASSENADHNF